ncbi:hypothetical protein CBER1_05925 [Cercospora berteroae]|uniref:Uncharacterized protein n=1 Tax=Cercospora berteroae TaxID=357750 RepID=A0A2S6BSC5_9PEZI|nr:hypothetical protein CBER1_05925 [Cercospora berteroae]
MRTRAQAHDAAAVDVAYLATTYGVAEHDVQQLLDAPTAELVEDFLLSLTDKGNEFDALKAEKLKVDVELDNTVRTTETKVKAQKAAVAKAQKEVEELRTKLNQSEAAREALAVELEQLKSSSSGSSAETQALRQRIETLEASNRDALALVESKSSEKDRVAIELSEQHSKLLALRREINQLEEKNSTLENAASSQKFREQALQQEIELLKKNNEWHASELQTRSQEHTKFRKERNARISSLERELEDSNANVEALKRTEATLRHRLDELQAKADEAFARIASLQEEAARKEQDFRAELNGSKRLAELQAQNAATHKARLQEVQGQVDQIKEDAAEEIGRLQAEVETERGDKETAEQKVAELELTVERLEQQPRMSRPGTPMRNGEPQTPGRNASPSAMPGSMRKVVNGLSFTQLYTKYTEAQEDLENERRRTNKLSTALDELVNELETRKPEIEDLKEEQDRLENEVLNFSGLLDEANAGKEGALRELERWKAEADTATHESQILRQQLRDLSAQVKILLVEIQSKDQNLGEMSADERLQIERAARGELDDGTLDELSSTGRLISERLVIFREVSDLQAQNEKLLRLTRELGEQMEGDEAKEKARQHEADAQEVGVLRQQVERYKDELTSTTTQIDSYMKERDMFRRMLQYRGQLAPDADMQSLFGQSVGPGTPQRHSVGPAATPRSVDEDLRKLLKEHQTHFDQFRNEASTDRRMLKDQADALMREKSSLQADLARAQSQLTLAAERYEMLQSNFTALRNENSELQKRSQQLGEQAARQDLRTQQVAEELVEARSMAESLRNENANAKAEKGLYKRIETRLQEENKTLLDDRSRLNKLVTDLQNLQNERELQESENRRRLQSRVESLETELNDAKKKLESEVEDSKKAALRREYEEGQSRTRIDDLVKSLGNVREELVAAKTSRDQLQTRVDELKIELRAAEERVTALQPRPSTRPEPTQNGEQQGADDEELPTEQRLALQVTELRRDLELQKAEVENAKKLVEQYQAIAQTSEEELSNLSVTADQFREDMDSLIAEKDAKITELEQRIEDISSELGTTNSELSELRTKADDSGRQLAEQKANHESELSRLRDEVERLEANAITIQQDVKTQAEIAQEAQTSYEVELQKHAEAAKSLASVRKEYNELKTDIARAKAEAEAAKASLERSEESWTEQKEQFERELEEAKRKRQDLDEQNQLLHSQMESFSKELTALRQGRAAATPAADAEGHEDAPSNSANLQEVINFLRREKEIVDTQYELSVQEAKRLQQQLEYANSQLEETRQKLADERRQSVEKASAESSTSKLMQTINELNVYRESATTLRNEARQARESLEQKSQEVERLLAEIEPLKSRVGELEGELEVKEGEMKLLQDDRDHWRDRTQNIISKYDRVDPAELEEMKKKLEELQAEKERLESAQAPLQEQIDGFEARLQSEKEAVTTPLHERLNKFKEQAKDQDVKRRTRITELTNENHTVTAEKDALATALEQAQTELASIQAELAETKTSLEEARTKATQVSSDDAEEGQVEEDGTATASSNDQTAMQAKIAESEAQAAEHAGRAENLENQVQTLQARVHELETQVSDLQQQLESAQTKSGVESSAPTADNTEILANLQQELATAQREVETLRANAVATPSETAVNAEPAAGEKSVAEQVAEEVAKQRAELEAQHQLATSQLEESNKAKIESMKSTLNARLKDERSKFRTEISAELKTEHEAELQALKDEHAAAIGQLKAEHEAALERFNADGASAIEKAEALSPVKAKLETPAATTDIDVKTLTFSNEQAIELVKTNAAIKELLTKSVRKQVDTQTMKLKDTIAAKEAEIKNLQEELAKLPTPAAAPSGEPNEAEADKLAREALEQQLETVRKELDAATEAKDAAVKQAVEAAEKKFKVQLNQRDIAMAKITAVQKAAQETPEKPVKEVWEVAQKARPAPKPAAANGPATTPAKPGVPAPAAAQPSAAPATSTFGQPSKPLGSPAPNPHAASFTPAAATTDASDGPASRPASQSGPSTAAAAPTKPAVGTGPSALRSLAGTSSIPAPGSKLPAPGGRSNPGSRKASISGPGTGLQVQGAAAGNALSQRGALSSGLPRGGAAGRGARGGIARGGARGNAANAGQKRAHDGAEPQAGGEVKRTRGGGPSGGA